MKRKGPREEVEEVGRRLFEAFFAGEVGLLWQMEASQSARRVRLCLHLRDADGSSDWPWEWLYDPHAKRFLALSVDTPLVRYPAAMAPVRPLRCTLPLRILVVAASPPGSGRIGVQQEWEALQASLQGLVNKGEVVLELLERATLPDLQRKLRKRFHIIHFIGHGFFDRNQREGGLLFEDEQGGGRRVTGRELGALLLGRKTVSLIILNACEGGRSDLAAPSAGVAQTLALAGVPAVVAMQFKITDPAAVVFARHFYEAIAEKDPVDVAVAEARQAMFSSDRNGIEWGTPVLFLRSSDGQLFDIRDDFWPRLWELLKKNWGFLMLLGACAVALILGLRAPDPSPQPPDKESRSGSTPPPDNPVHPPNTRGCPRSKLLGLEFVRIDPGTFIMESKRSFAGKKRVYEVEITRPYCMSATEVTQEQWYNVMHYNPSAHKGIERLPVENVSHADAEKFAAELNRLEPGVGYSLPTEAQWQYGAQADTGQRFAFGGDPDDLSLYGNCKGGNDGFDGTAPVASFRPNRWGLYDMHGNVSEWVVDWYAEYPWEPRSDPRGPLTGTRRVRRGGSWDIVAKNCDAVTRNDSEPGTRADDVGFRLVRTPED
ncbi:MAG TPA: SUMF1/EgtB/PvdO family nonheme iron enzyme [Thermoanaerobaculia bacterium]|nr:SUMF1/EgtB/PvdO family nonheme iron enzyme [Thermoanaerobaculia bacterium]